MSVIKVGELTFAFPDGWEASPLDEWSYYRNQFQRLGNGIRVACSKCSAELVCKACETPKNAGIKSCDIVAIWDSTVWLIEVKDFRSHPRTKAINLADEIAIKVRDSLAILFGAQISASDATEKEFARRATSCIRIRVVLHLEQPVKPSRVSPRAINTANTLHA